MDGKLRLSYEKSTLFSKLKTVLDFEVAGSELKVKWESVSSVSCTFSVLIINLTLLKAKTAKKRTRDSSGE